MLFPQIGHFGAFSSPFAGRRSRYLRGLKPVSLGSMAGLQTLVTGVSGYVGAALAAAAKFSAWRRSTSTKVLPAAGPSIEWIR